jgi:hypothetical protein
MFFIVGNYYEGFYLTLQARANQAQLSQVSDYIASNLIDLVTLSKLTNENQFLAKEISPPAFIEEKLYRISIAAMFPPNGDTEVIRVITSMDATNLYSTSDLPWLKTDNFQIYTDQVLPDQYDDRLAPSNNLLSDASLAKSAQIDETAMMVVWCSKVDDSTTVGIGVMVASRGG